MKRKDPPTFTTSLRGTPEQALLGFHGCTTHRTTATVATPADLMVMMAAMLRDKASEPYDEPYGEDEEVPFHALQKLVLRNETKAVSRVRLPAAELRGEPRFELPKVFDRVRLAGDRASVAQSAPAFFALAWRLDELVRHPKVWKQGCEDFRSAGVDGRFIGVPGVGTDRHTVAIEKANKCLGPTPEGHTRCFVDEKALKQVVADFFKGERVARAGLPLGDARCLLVEFGANSDALLARLRRHIALHRNGPTYAFDLVRALIELDRADVAAMLFGMLGYEAREALFITVQRAARNQEMRSIVAKHGYDRELKSWSPPLRLMKAFDSRGAAVVKQAAVESLRNAHTLFVRRTLKPGAPAYHDAVMFEQRWAAVTRGILDGWDWQNCVASGGAVVRALVGEDFPDRDVSFGDVDLFFYGIDDYSPGLPNRIAALANHVRSKVGAENYAVLVTTKNVTIVIENAPRIQVATGLWSSIDDVLSTVDVDCCGVAYDGRDVVMTGRAAAAYAVRGNVASASRHAVRGSIHYEMRLWKYAMLYGFRVIDPLHPLDTDNELIQRCQSEMVASFAKKRPDSRAAQRHAATNLSGLQWLMAVNAGLVKPFVPKDDLAVGRDRRLADVLKTVAEKEYLPSDGYGTHEQGYVVVQQEGEPGPGDPQPYDAPCSSAFLPGYGNVYHCNFHRFVPFSDHDARYVYTPSAWVLQPSTSKAASRT